MEGGFTSPGQQGLHRCCHSVHRNLAFLRIFSQFLRSNIGSADKYKNTKKQAPILSSSVCRLLSNITFQRNTYHFSIICARSHGCHRSRFLLHGQTCKVKNKQLIFSAELLKSVGPALEKRKKPKLQPANGLSADGLSFFDPADQRISEEVSLF